MATMALKTENSKTETQVHNSTQTCDSRYSCIKQNQDNHVQRLQMFTLIVGLLSLLLLLPILSPGQ